MMRFWHYVPALTIAVWMIGIVSAWIVRKVAYSKAFRKVGDFDRQKPK